MAYEPKLDTFKAVINGQSWYLTETIALASSGTHFLELTTGANKFVCVVAMKALHDLTLGEINLYENESGTAGTAATAQNNNRDLVTSTVVTLTDGVTATPASNPILPGVILGIKNDTSELGDQGLIILKKSTDYLIEVVNLDAQARTMELTVAWLELENLISV